MDSNKESTTKAVQSMYFIIRGMQSSGVITESFADKMIENITVCASYKKFKASFNDSYIFSVSCYLSNSCVFLFRITYKFVKKINFKLVW